MKQKWIGQYFLMALGFSIVIALFIHLTPLIESLQPRGNRLQGRGPHVVLNMIVTALVTFCTFALNYFIVMTSPSGSKMTTRQVIQAVVITLFCVIILSDVFFALLHGGNRFRLFRFNFVYTIRDLVISVFVFGGIYFVRTVIERQRILLENERLTSENLQSKYEALKSQLSPHFLFNSLSALKSLVQTNPGQAQTYVDHLSDVLRYSLSGTVSKTITVEEELGMLQSYLYLHKMRYGDNLTIEITVDTAYHQRRVPPLSLQTLVENAIKHNVISKKYPLTIRIYVENDHLVVANVIKEKLSEETGTGIGLPNLDNQFKLLGYEGIKIEKRGDEFSVAIPLLTTADHARIDR